MEAIPSCVLINKPDVFSLTQHNTTQVVLCCVRLNSCGLFITEIFRTEGRIFFLLRFYLKSERFRDTLMKAIVKIYVQ